MVINWKKLFFCSGVLSITLFIGIRICNEYIKIPLMSFADSIWYSAFPIYYGVTFGFMMQEKSKKNKAVEERMIKGISSGTFLMLVCFLVLFANGVFSLNNEMVNKYIVKDAVSSFALAVCPFALFITRLIEDIKKHKHKS